MDGLKFQTENQVGGIKYHRCLRAALLNKNSVVLRDIARNASVVKVRGEWKAHPFAATTIIKIRNEMLLKRIRNVQRKLK